MLFAQAAALVAACRRRGVHTGVALALTVLSAGLTLVALVTAIAIAIARGCPGAEPPCWS